MAELIDIELRLQKIQDDFNSQINSLKEKDKEFHSDIIKLTAKYPDQYELIQFMVLVNDKLETNQTVFTIIMSESVNDLIDTKKMVLERIKLQMKTKIMSLPKKFEFIKDIKFILGSISFILALGGLFFYPEVVTPLVKSFFGIK